MRHDTRRQIGSQPVEQTVRRLAEMAAEPDCTFHPPASLFQDFSVRCRMRRVKLDGYDVHALIAY